MFQLTKEQRDKLAQWMNDTVTPTLIARQKESIAPDHPSYSVFKMSWDCGAPYLGAISGGLTYMFTPTSIGTVVKVKHAGIEEVLDLSDYDDW